MEPRPSSHERTVALWTVLALLVAGVVATGSWGLTHDASASGPAVVGQLVSVPGGAARVDAVAHLPNDPMKMSGPGMAMPMSPGPGVKPLPKGFHRFAVAVTLIAKAAPGIRFRPGSFRVVAVGFGPARSTSLDLQPVFVPDRGSYSQILEFQAPMTAHGLVLRITGADRPISLGMRPLPPGMQMSPGMDMGS